MKEKKLKWNTWIGKNYSKMNNRILILGQNPYAWPEDKGEKIINSPEFVNILVKEHGLYFTNDWGGIKNSKLFRAIERMIFNKKYPSQDEIKNFWNSVAFNQFVQRYTSNAKEKLNDKDYKEGWKNLYAILENLKPKPTLILLLGTTSLNPKVVPNSPDFQILNMKYHKKIGKDTPKTAIFKINNYEIPIIAVRHPSSFFSWTKWHNFITPYISDFLEEL